MTSRIPGRRSRLATSAARLLLVAALTSCADARASSIPAELRELRVTAADFVFRAPDSIPAGLTRIKLVNDGPEPHHLVLLRLADGHDVRELVDSFTPSALPEWATPVGGPGAPPATGFSEVIIDLEAGRYAMICLISSRDGTRHLMKGMFRPLTVTAAAGAPSPAPKADAVMVLGDYSSDVTPALRPGHRVIRVENRGTQPHEVTIVRRAAGKTTEDLMQWLRTRQGPLPGELVGGATPFAPGVVNIVTGQFPAGDYTLLCFVPDTKDGKSHVAHGMVRDLRIE